MPFHLSSTITRYCLIYEVSKLIEKCPFLIPVVRKRTLILKFQKCLYFPNFIICQGYCFKITFIVIIYKW